MDLAWAEHHISAPPAELKRNGARAPNPRGGDDKSELIRACGPLSRTCGVIAALALHVQAACKRRGLAAIEVPEE